MRDPEAGDPAILCYGSGAAPIPSAAVVTAVRDGAVIRVRRITPMLAFHPGEFAVEGMAAEDYKDLMLLCPVEPDASA